MLNKVILMGRLVRDPELRYTQSNLAVASFTIAVDRNRKSEGQPTADFIDIVAWGKSGEFVSQWFQKGSLIVVVGRLQSRNWEDRNGNKRVSIEVVAEEVQFGESKKSRESYGGAAAPYGRENASNTAPSYDLPAEDSDFSELSDDDGDVPF